MMYSDVQNVCICTCNKLHVHGIIGTQCIYVHILYVVHTVDILYMYVSTCMRSGWIYVCVYVCVCVRM